MKADHLGIGMTSPRTRARLIARLVNMGIKSAVVLDAINNIPRHLFVDEALASRAYENTALPIGFNQSISQPYIVARMTEALLGDSEPPAKILEIGTGCGYQTAVLARLVKKIYSIERIASLCNRARKTLSALHIHNVRIKHGDGCRGWPERAPFDGIIAAAAAPGVPELLLQQLAPGARLVIPVGGSGEQKLLRITRTDTGFTEDQLDLVTFVPMQEGTG